jgi:hypothetical protein
MEGFMEPTVPTFRSVDRWNSVVIPERVARRALTNVERQPDGCWISRYSTASHGYAQVGWSIPKAERRNGARNAMVLAHRAAWTAVNGQVPMGMTLDHTCKVRRCVNPDHLRLLPNYENARRTSGRDWPMGQCANGHPAQLLTADGHGGLICAPCKRIYQGRRNWRTRHKGQPMPAHLLLASERKAS